MPCIDLAGAFVWSVMPRFRVLGPTEVLVGESLVDIGGPRSRRLLTALLVAEGRPVPDDQLAEAVWDAHPPAQPAASLQVYVSRLRPHIRAAGASVVRCAGIGYRILLPADTTDAERFASGLATARALLAEHRAGEALRELDTALALWRGEAYADLPAFPPALAARARLAELRAVAVEERLAARLATGDAAGTVAELDTAVRAAPYRERGWALLVLGLYRCGRQGDALATLRRVRAVLADELGIDPGPELQGLERQVLAQDPRLLLPDPPPAPPASPGTTSSPATSRLAPPLSTFVGREDELAALGHLVATQRLVALVGPAGAGKTRLAVEYAALREDADGPWLVRLADVTDPRLLPGAIAAALGLTPADGDPLARLVLALHARDGLLLLDNCEHLVAAVADLVVMLLARVGRLTVLATSREPLGVDGERVLPVGPLPIGPATALLVDRITAIRPEWQPDAEDLDQAHRLATALDGIPLALELAAARARVLGLRELADNVREHLAVLGPVPRGSLTVHATLDAAIAWSVDLLSTPDRALLVRLWPFDGGFSLDAIDAVRSPDHRQNALEALSSLVTRSVVVADTSMAPSRYRLLETVRGYCRAHDPQPDGSREAHAAWVRRLVARGEKDMLGERSVHAMRVLSRELPNIRAGIAHDLRVAPADALRTVGRLSWFWYRTGRVAEGHRLLNASLDAAPDAPPIDVARAWSAHGVLYFIENDVPGIAHALRRAFEALGTPDDHAGRVLHAQLHFYDAFFQLANDDPRAAQRSATEAVRAGTELGAEWVAATGQTMLGAVLLAMGQATEGRDMLHTAITRALGCGQNWTAAYTELLLAQHMLAAGDPVEDTLWTLRRAVAGLRREDDISNLLAALHTGALALASAGQVEQAARLRAATLRQAARHGISRIEITTALTAALDAALGPMPVPATIVDTEALDWDTTIDLLNDDRTR